MIWVISFTRAGAALSRRLLARLPQPCRGYAPPRYGEGELLPYAGDLRRWTGERFVTGDALLFVGAAGIAVRAVAPFVRSKQTDPAVVAVDELGRFAIPLLSGHLGGANRLAREVAALCGGTAVVTTATDGRGVFSPDGWAAENGYRIPRIEAVKMVAAALLEGETVGLRSEFPVITPLPEGVAAEGEFRCGVEIALRPRAPFPHTLHLLPRCLVAGMGCRKGVEAAVLEQRLREVLDIHQLPLDAVGAVATIHRKEEEPGLLALCKKLGVPLLGYSPGELGELPGEFTPSQRVLDTVGVDNVCERAAVRAAEGGALLVRKDAGQGVTVAVARRQWKVAF